MALPFEYPVLAVIVAAFLAFLLGVVWYHPKVLGTRWLAARGVTEKAASPSAFQALMSLALWLMAACFFAFLISMLEISGLPGLISLACLVWVAFSMPPIVMGSLFTGYPFQAAAIDSAYQLGGYYLFALVFQFLS